MILEYPLCKYSVLLVLTAAASSYRLSMRQLFTLLISRGKLMSTSTELCDYPWSQATQRMIETEHEETCSVNKWRMDAFNQRSQGDNTFNVKACGMICISFTKQMRTVPYVLVSFHVFCVDTLLRRCAFSTLFSENLRPSRAPHVLQRYESW